MPPPKPKVEEEAKAHKKLMKKSDWIGTKKSPEQNYEEPSMEAVDVDKEEMGPSYFEPKSDIKRQVREMKKSKLFAKFLDKESKKNTTRDSEHESKGKPKNILKQMQGAKTKNDSRVRQLKNESQVDSEYEYKLKLLTDEKNAFVDTKARQMMSPRATEESRLNATNDERELMGHSEQILGQIHQEMIGKHNPEQVRMQHVHDKNFVVNLGESFMQQQPRAEEPPPEKSP